MQYRLVGVPFAQMTLHVTAHTYMAAKLMDLVQRFRQNQRECTGMVTLFMRYGGRDGCGKWSGSL